MADPNPPAEDDVLGDIEPAVLVLGGGPKLAGSLREDKGVDWWSCAALLEDELLPLPIHPACKSVSPWKSVETWVANDRTI